MKTFLAPLLLLAAPAALGATRGAVTGSFAPGETLAPPASDAPVTESRTFVRSVAPLAGQARVELPATGGSSLLVWTIPAAQQAPGFAVAMRAGEAAGRLSTRLSTPSGDVLEPGNDDSVGPLRRFAIDDFGPAELGLPVAREQEVIHVRGAEPGTYLLELSAAEGNAFTVVVGEPSSPLTLRSWASPLSRRAGEPVTLHAVLSDGAAVLTGATVAARLAPANGPALVDVTLFDDGAHGDGSAGDGHYAAAVASLPDVAGPWKVRIDASGTGTRGHAFARTGASGFVNEPLLALLGPVSARLDGERLHVEARVDVKRPGAYRFDVLVGGPAAADGSRPGVAWGESTEELAAGPARLVLDIPASQLGAADGPLHADVRLLGLDTIGVAGRITLDVTR